MQAPEEHKSAAEQLYQMYQAAALFIGKAFSNPGGEIPTQLQRLVAAVPARPYELISTKIKRQLEAATNLLGSNLEKGVKKLKPGSLDDFMTCVVLLGVDMPHDVQIGWQEGLQLSADMYMRLGRDELREKQLQCLAEVGPDKVWLRLELCVVCVLLHC